ncbi:hypothetical protein CLV84_3869 [Neolewinella xylanilytica]|uniref:Uncharacterized protein n=1 Tax=Neolewinella xylanilytica TaxID=1514080 RepID=A0A2S6I164_9BACT|nr:hypothetical protein [Neolewinella xylanilytica]PPK84707.1 hypothetical protein CLV84_3869 [Neolewinella xylanilytica]
MHTKPIFIYLSAVLLLLGMACAPRQLEKPYPAPRTERQYTKAVADAANPRPEKVYRSLLPIVPDNGALVRRVIAGEEYVLVSSWKDDTTFYRNDSVSGFYHTGSYPIWVTAAPQLRDICSPKHFGRREGVDLRLKQLFGMPPTVSKRYFVEFWVRPADLYRPCPDPEVEDGECGLAFTDRSTPEHQEWINTQRLASYSHTDRYANYPWTQLGYTYDWSPRKRSTVGLSEFVIGRNKRVVVNGIYTTAEYCQVAQ